MIKRDYFTVGDFIRILEKEDESARIDFQLCTFPEINRQPETFKTMGISRLMTSYQHAGKETQEAGSPYIFLLRILTPAEKCYTDRFRAPGRPC